MDEGFRQLDVNARRKLVTRAKERLRHLYKIPSSLNAGTFLQCSSRVESNHMCVMTLVKPTP